ncbi:MAG: flagellar biosynthesis protein FlhF [Deltaproteobacteria bacterium]
MQVKRYEVASMNDAMTRIKNDLGPDAIILSARKIKSGRQEIFEVMAARDENTTIPEHGPIRPGSGYHMSLQDAKEDIFTYFRSELKEIREAIETFQRQNSLGRELAEMKETMNSFFDVLGMRQGRAPQDLNSKIYLHLLSSGFSRASACRIVDAISQKASAPGQMSEAQALALAERHIGNSLPDIRETGREKRIKMFIGPTGVGKTTTLAKLAARYSIMKKKNVGLITTDNFRIAAAEQLGTYAKIMGLRMERASTRETFDKALKVFADKDIILVDTPGRARPDDGYLNQLEQTLPDQTIETNLLINATGSEDHLENIVSGYSRFRIDHLIVTKIDESRRFGMLYDIISKTRKPVVYLTCGQNVPQDIEEVTPARMANLMLRRSIQFAKDGSDIQASPKQGVI